MFYTKTQAFPTPTSKFFKHQRIFLEKKNKNKTQISRLQQKFEMQGIGQILRTALHIKNTQLCEQNA